MGIVFEKEKDLEDLLFEEMVNGSCLITGSNVLNARRQVDSGGYGVIDLIAVCVDEEIESACSDEACAMLNIYELKNGPIKIDAVLQISRYKKAISRAMRSWPSSIRNCRTRFHLVGNSVEDQSDMVYVTEAIPDLTLWTFEIDVHNGIEFESHEGWYNVKEEFSRLDGLRDEVDESVKARSDFLKNRKQPGLEVVK